MCKLRENDTHTRTTKHIWPGRTKHISNITRNHNCSIFNDTKRLSVHRAHTAHSYTTPNNRKLWNRIFECVVDIKSAFVLRYNIENFTIHSMKQNKLSRSNIQILHDIARRHAHEARALRTESNFVCFLILYFVGIIILPNKSHHNFPWQKKCAVLPYVIWLYLYDELEWMMDFLVSRIVIDKF